MQDLNDGTNGENKLLDGILMALGMGDSQNNNNKRNIYDNSGEQDRNNFKNGSDSNDPETLQHPSYEEREGEHKEETHM